MVPFIVVASGKGRRAGGDLPKQFQLLDGKPILYHTLCHLEEAGVTQCIVVMDPSYEGLMAPYFGELKMDIGIVPGGVERFDSVKNGIEKVPLGISWVGIHDGVRPFISKELIQRLLEEVATDEWDYVIPGNALKDTIKEVKDGEIMGTKDRESLYGAGTPQMVRLSMYHDALFKNVTGTDDGMIMEAIGGRGKLVSNDELNVKITTPDDLFLAPYRYQLFKKRKS